MNNQADDSHEMSSFIFSEKNIKKTFKMSSAAVAIAALRVIINWCESWEMAFYADEDNKALISQYIVAV